MSEIKITDEVLEDVIGKVAELHSRWKELITEAAKTNHTLADTPKSNYSFLREELVPRLIQFFHDWEDLEKLEKELKPRWGKRVSEMFDQIRNSLQSTVAEDLALAWAHLYCFGKPARSTSKKESV